MDCVGMAKTPTNHSNAALNRCRSPLSPCSGPHCATNGVNTTFRRRSRPGPQAPKRTGPRSAAVLVRRMRASTKACGEVSSAAPRPLRCARDPRTRTAALHKVPLSLGRICSSGWHPRGVRPTAGLLSFTRRLPRIPCSLRGLEHGGRVHALAARGSGAGSYLMTPQWDSKRPRSPPVIMPSPSKSP